MDQGGKHGDEEDKRPHLGLAASNDTPEAGRERATIEFSWPLRELAANIMRVSRGAGSPHELLKQCISVTEAYGAYYREFSDLPRADQITDMLDFRNPDKRFSDDEVALSRESIVGGALRLAAGRILGQDLQA